MNCPYIDETEPRCSECLNMRNLEEAFELCLDHYVLCPLYRELNRSRFVALGAGVRAKRLDAVAN